MSFCTQCGKPIEEDAQFCTNCGHKLEVAKAKENNTTTRTTRSSKKESEFFWKKWSKKQKGVTIGSALLVIILLASYFIISFMLDKDRLITGFEEAVQEGDIEELSSLLNSSKDLELTEDNLKSFAAWLQEDEEEFNNLIRDLKQQSRNPDSSNDDSILVLKQDEKKFLGIFKKYTLEVTPIHIELSAPYKNTVFSINEKEVGVLSEDGETIVAGPFLAGPYSIEASFVDDFVDITSSQQVTLLPNSNSNYIYFDMEAAEVTISTDLGWLEEEAELLVNGESVEWALGTDQTFGPVLLDGSTKMALKVFFPWGEVTTSEQTVDRHDVFFNIKADEEIKNKVIELTEQGLTTYMNVRANVSTEGIDNIGDGASEALIELVLADDHNQKWKTSKPLYFDIYPSSYNIFLEDGVYKLSTIAKLTEQLEYTDFIEESETLLSFEFKFDETNEEWILDAVQYSNAYLFEEPEQQLFTYEDTFENSQFKGDVSEEIIELVENHFYTYIHSLVAGINEDEFDYVKPLLKKNSPLYKSQRQLIKDLNDRGITEEVYDYSISNISQNDNIITFEAYEAIYVMEEGSEPVLTENVWIYTGELDDDEFVLTTIEEK